VYELICIGASWGGLQAVGRLLSDIPGDLEQPIVIAQHRHRDSTEGMLPELLRLRIDRPVLDVEDKTAIEPRRVYIAPTDYHLLVQRGSFALSLDERVQFARPSIDVLFESAADAYGPAVIGIILTGSNEDGASGLARIKERGGVAVIQDPAGALRRTMPDAAIAAIAATAADAILPLEEIGKFLYGLCMRTAPVREAAKPPVRASGPVEGARGNREVPPRKTGV
jgi:two-component system chemotaxis response regulator CheB